MEFNFKPLENIKSFNEFSYYNDKNDLETKLLNLFIPMFIATSIFFILFIIFSFGQYSLFNNITFILVAIGLTCPFIFFLLSFKDDNMKNKLATNNFSDIDSINYFSIDTNSITKKNDYSSITIVLSEISKITILEDTIILSNPYITFFIPILSLPTGLDSFIDIFKKANTNIIIKKDLSHKKKLNKVNIFMFLTGITLALIASYFFNLYNT